MEKIIYSSLFISIVQELSTKLFENEYFGFIGDAEDYVKKILDFTDTIPLLKHKRTLNTKYGIYYCKYKQNHKTTWYITFDVEENTYLIKYITNNHSADYPEFISWLG
jgi:hypothetical protein